MCFTSIVHSVLLLNLMCFTSIVHSVLLLNLMCFTSIVHHVLLLNMMCFTFIVQCFVIELDVFHIHCSLCFAFGRHDG